MTDSSKPSISFCGLRIFASRDGDRVTGRVEFPYECNGRTECPIDYRSLRTDSAIGSQPSAVSSKQNSTFDIRHSTLDDRARKRLELIEQWRKLCDEHPDVAKTTLAQQLAAGRGISVSSLRQWAKTLDLEGPEGLRDRYVPRSKKVLTLDANQARNAVMACVWWAFRIGNCECIDTKMMHVAFTQLIDPGYDVADLLATIDCYYSYSCDRTKFPFKPFARWAKHDFPVPWLYRACDENDYRRGLAATRNGQVPLQAPRTTMSPAVASAQMRKRETLHGPTRKAIRSLHPESAVSHQPSANSTFDIRHSTFPSPLESSPPRSPSEPASKTLLAASMLKSTGLPGAATRVVQAAAPGIPALAANMSPQTIAEALGTLDDGYRGMLSRAAHGDRQAREQAIATMPLWWDSMPQEVRGNIDFKVDYWQRWHGTTDHATAARKLAMLLPKFRGEHTGAQRLCPAARIPV